MTISNTQLKDYIDTEFDWYQSETSTPPEILESNFDWYSSGNFPEETETPQSKVLLVGLGPHSKRIYIHFLKKLKELPTLIIEIQSKKEEVLRFLKEENINAATYFIDDRYKFMENLPSYIAYDIAALLKKHKIQKSIISTEPKAHKAYLNLLIENDIDILTDKPITSPNNVSDNFENSYKIWSDYAEILSKKQKRESDINIEVQCQRRYHKGYQYIKYLIDNIIRDYNVPITYIDSYHCDGMWNMPDEFLTRENHPYKYGYGKLCHSGYHFIDLVSWLLQSNNQLESKRANKFTLHSTATRATDSMHTLNASDYKRFFGRDNAFKESIKYQANQFPATGEVDFHSLITMKKDEKVVTVVHLGLMQSGFSRRSWDTLPENTYKGNGRIRHERLNLHIGPLMNIQVHSYQSKEVKDRVDSDEHCPGNLEHFDIYIFRNTGLINGEPFEHISSKNLLKSRGKEKSFIGFNELAREECLKKFLYQKSGNSKLEDHFLSVKLMQKCYESISLQYEGRESTVESNLEY